MVASQFGFGGSLASGINRIRNSWGWFMTLGILLILLGAVCIIADVTATFATVLVFGWFLLISGIVALVHAFRVNSWNGFFLYLLSALFRGFTGYVMIRYPLAGALALTFVLASFFIVGGTFRAAGAASLRLPGWGWAVFSGVVSLALGVVLLAQLPVSSVWFIGFAVGIDMILEGASLIGVATGLRALPATPVTYMDKAA